MDYLHFRLVTTAKTIHLHATNFSTIEFPNMGQDPLNANILMNWSDWGKEILFVVF